MLRFEGIKEFDIEKLNSKDLSRNFQIVFSDDILSMRDCEIIEKSLNKHDFSIKNEKVKIEIIYNIDLNNAIITMTIYCPLMHLNQILEEKLLNFIDKHKNNFEYYYDQIKPY